MRNLNFTTTMLAGLLLTGCATTGSIPDPLPSATESGLTLKVAAGSQDVDLSEPLGPDALAVIAVFTNPDLKALRARAGVAEAQVFAAGLYPDPTFSLGFDVPLNGTGLVPALGAGLGYDFAALARRPSTLRAARADQERLQYDIVWAEWLTGEQARLLAARVSHLRRIKTQTEALRRYADDELQRALRAASRGDLPPASLETRRLAATDAADRNRTVELQLRSAELDLNRVLGIDPAETLSIEAPAASAKPLPSVQSIFMSAQTVRADLAALRAGYQGSAATIDAARLGAYPLPALGINAARDTGKLNTLGPNVSFTLPIWNRGQGNLAIAKAGQAQLRADYAARVESVRADIASARAAAEITRAQRADVTRDIAPLVQQAEANDRAAARGDISISTANAAHMTLLDKQITEAVLALAVAEYEIVLEISAGQPLEAIE